MEKKIYVYENWSSDAPRKLGTLFVENLRGSEHSSFQFDNAFLADACTSQILMLDPDLSLVKGRQFPAAGKSTFGIFSDSSPDRWGRLLMERREKLNADKRNDNRKQKRNDDFNNASLEIGNAYFNNSHYQKHGRAHKKSVPQCKFFRNAD